MDIREFNQYAEQTKQSVSDIMRGTAVNHAEDGPGIICEVYSYEVELNDYSFKVDFFKAGKMRTFFLNKAVSAGVITVPEDALAAYNEYIEKLRVARKEAYSKYHNFD